MRDIFSHLNTPKEPEAPEPGDFQIVKPTPAPIRLNNRDLQQAINATFNLWQETAVQSDTFYNHLVILLEIQLIRARREQIE